MAEYPSSEEMTQALILAITKRDDGLTPEEREFILDVQRRYAEADAERLIGLAELLLGS